MSRTDGLAAACAALFLCLLAGESAIVRDEPGAARRHDPAAHGNPKLARATDGEPVPAALGTGIDSTWTLARWKRNTECLDASSTPPAPPPASSR